MGCEFPPHHPWDWRHHELINFNEPFSGSCPEYQALARAYLDVAYGHPEGFRTSFRPGTTRARNRDRAAIVWNGTPANYEYWLSEAVREDSRGISER